MIQKCRVNIIAHSFFSIKRENQAQYCFMSKSKGAPIRHKQANFSKKNLLSHILVESLYIFSFVLSIAKYYVSITSGDNKKWLKRNCYINLPNLD